MTITTVKKYTDRIEIVSNTLDDIAEGIDNIFLLSLCVNIDNEIIIGAIGIGEDIALETIKMGASIYKAVQIVLEHYPNEPQQIIHRVIMEKEYNQIMDSKATEHAEMIFKKLFKDGIPPGYTRLNNLIEIIWLGIKKKKIGKWATIYCAAENAINAGYILCLNYKIISFNRETEIKKKEGKNEDYIVDVISFLRWAMEQDFFPKRLTNSPSWKAYI